MGFDKLLNYLLYNLGQDINNEYNITANIKKNHANHIMFDICFLIYQALIDIEDETNTIIKIILSIPFSMYDSATITNKILEICTNKHWINNIEYIENILDGDNETDIINNFTNYLKKSNIIENIIIDKIYYIIVDNIKNIHILDFVKTINIIFDGIPSYSKILEQRRRRIKNYIESKYRKLNFNNYFDDIENSYYEYNGIKFNFFKWLKYRFSIDKSFGPISPFIKNLEVILYNKLSYEYPNIKININSGVINGEADYKIFNEIYKNNYLGEIVIHSIDSDLIHQIIVQQNYFNLTNKDINLSIIKYNHKDPNYIQFIDGQIINKTIIKNYCSINNIQTISNLIIYDLSIIFYFFGNDHLPISYDFGSEINFDYYCKSHYAALKNNTIITLDSNGNIKFDINNFKLYLIELNKYNEINRTKILLGRYFKLNYQLSSYLTDKLKLNFNQILLLCKKILYDSGKNTKDLDEDDIRYKLINKYKNMVLPYTLNYLDKNEFDNNMIKLLNILDILDTEDNYCGLPLYNKQYFFNNDKYENMYLYYNDLIINNLYSQYSLIYDYKSIDNIVKSNNIVINNNEIIESYLKKIYHLVTTLFGNMSQYNSNNFTYFKGYETPTINSIIDYLENPTDLITNWDNQIKKETVETNEYFNSINHHLIITPYIKEILAKFNDSNILLNIEKINIENFWYKNTLNFEFKSFSLDEFIKCSKSYFVELPLNIIEK